MVGPKRFKPNPDQNKVGPTSPIVGQDKLHVDKFQDIPNLRVSGALIVDFDGANKGEVTPGITFGPNSKEGISSNRAGTINPAGLDFYTDGEVRLSISSKGNVGINTGSPSGMLHVFQKQGATGQPLLLTSYGAGPGSGIRFHNPTGKTYEIFSSGGSLHVFDVEAGVDRIIVDKNGCTGIGDVRINDHQVWLRGGTDTNHGVGWYGVPGRDQKVFAGAAIDGPVVFGYGGGALGTTNGGQKTALSWDSNGNVNVRGDVILQGADCAEEFTIAHGETIEPGTVMVIAADGVLMASRQAYDKRVAGVVSGAGDLRPGVILDRQEEKANRLPLALTGKVYCKVDADYGPVEVGDLLTTSPTRGHAMKASECGKAFGTIIGKALRTLETGKGLVPILVALQ